MASFICGSSMETEPKHILCSEKERFRAIEEKQVGIEQRISTMETNLVEKISDNRDIVSNQYADVKKSIDDLTNLMRGSNSNPGIITKVCLLRQSVQRAWWWLGGISLTILGVFGYILKKGVD